MQNLFEENPPSFGKTAETLCRILNDCQEVKFAEQI
jgi:hypothetical protein